MFSIMKDVAKHSIIYGVSDILSRAIGFIMIPLYTHYLTPSDYGTLELLDLTCYIIGIFVAMGVAQAVIRFYYDYTDQVKRDQVISVAMITLWVVFAAVLCLLLLFSRQISFIVFKSADFYHLLNIIFISTVVGLSNEIPLTLLRIEGKSVAYVAISLSKLVITLTLNILFIVKFRMGVPGILYSGLIAASLIGIFVTAMTLRRLKLSFDFVILKKMLSYGLPLMWTWAGMFIVNFGDRFFLQRLESLSAVGIYSLAYKFGMLPNIVILSPFLMIWAPKRFDLLKEPNAKEIYSTIFTYFMFLQIFLGLGVSLSIKEVIQIIAEQSFWGAWQYVIPILLAYIFNGVYIFVQFGIHLENKTKYLAYASLFAAAINISGNFLLIPIFHIWGAALSTLATFVFLMIYVYIPSQKYYHIPYQWKRIAHMAVIAVALYCVSWFIPIESAIPRLIVKLVIAMMFPFALFVTRFYTEKERQKIGAILRSISKLDFSSLRGGSV